ncbi:hypothetical protein QQF64_020780 [Cirrhinus molitorella]|uniref:Uncharacterized protein n=1 Tax=Cirrhinus molitorella TaxID=172907 RepID=A0ABR3LBL9_9TELE
MFEGCGGEWRECGRARKRVGTLPSGRMPAVLELCVTTRTPCQKGFPLTHLNTHTIHSHININPQCWWMCLMWRGAETVQIVATSRAGSQGQCSVTVEGLAGLYLCVSRVGREGSFSALHDPAKISVQSKRTLFEEVKPVRHSECRAGSNDSDKVRFVVSHRPSAVLSLFACGMKGLNLHTGGSTVYTVTSDPWARGM